MPSSSFFIWVVPTASLTSVMEIEGGNVKAFYNVKPPNKFKLSLVWLHTQSQRVAGLDRIIHSLHVCRTLGIYQSYFSMLELKENDFCHPAVHGFEWIMKDLKRKKTGRIFKESNPSLGKGSKLSTPLKINLPKAEKPGLFQNRISHGPEQYLPGKLRNARGSEGVKPGSTKRTIQGKRHQGKQGEQKGKQKLSPEGRGGSRGAGKGQGKLDAFRVA